MANNDKSILIVAVIVLGLVAFLMTKPSVGPAEEDWQESYEQSALEAGLNPKYFDHDSIIDTNEEMVLIASKIKEDSINAKDAVKTTLDYVYSTVRYTPSNPACYQESATDVFNERVGNCVSMTKLNVALLREMGIAARPAGGCISQSFSCNVLFSFHPERTPQFVPVQLDDNFKRGGLHEWFEFWLPDEGWLIGEATSGQVFSKSCVSYDYHDYNTDSVGMCVIQDFNYIRQCGRF